MPTTPEDWLPILASKLDARTPKIAKHRSYCNGNAPLPEMGNNLKASWKEFQKKARLNYGGLAVGALKNRIRPQGVRVGGSTDSQLARQAERIWRDNRAATQFSQAIVDRLETGHGYLAVGADNGRAVLSRQKPEYFIAETHPLQPWVARAALQVWRDTLDHKDYASVWVAGYRQLFRRDSKNTFGAFRGYAADNEWAPYGEPELYVGHPPVVVLSRPSGQSLLEQHYDAIDSINLGKLQRLVIVAMQAFRQRGIKGDLPSEDEDGNQIDWAKVFEPAPGALWDLPAGIDVWESEQTDVRPLLEAEKADRRDFAALTTTPLSVFIPDGANQSAEGAANAKENHVSLAVDEIDDIKPGLAMALVHALRIEGADLGEETVEVDFAPPALVSMNEKYAAAAQASGILARRTILREILGMTPEQIRQDEADLITEQLNSAFTVDANADGNTS